MKQNSESRAKNNPRNSQKNVFSQYVLGNLLIIKSQNLQSCQLSLPLRNINIIQIIQNYKCKHSCRNDQYYNNNPQCAEHSFHLGSQTGGIADTEGSRLFNDLFSDFLCLLQIFILYRKYNILIIRFFPKGLFIYLGSHIDVVSHVVFCDHSDLCPKLFVFPLQGNGISHLKIQKLRCLFTDHRTLVSQLIDLSCKTVSQCHILPEGFHIFRYIEINTDIGFPVGSCNLTELNVCKPFQFFIFVQIFHQLLSVFIRSVLIRNNSSVIVLKLRILFHHNI